MRFLLLCLLACLPVTGYSLTLKGVELEDSLQVKDQTLVLNGAGVRSKYFMNVYVAGLYLPEKTHDADAIMTAKEPQSIHLHIISSHITRSRLIETIEEGIELSAGEDFPRYKPMLKELWDALTFEVEVGDTFVFTYLPGEGTHFYRNGEVLRVQKDFNFKQVLFGIWLGPEPVQESVKEDLLGKK